MVEKGNHRTGSGDREEPERQAPASELDDSERAVNETASAAAGVDAAASAASRPAATGDSAASPRTLDAPARALAANLSAFTTKSQSSLYPQEGSADAARSPGRRAMPCERGGPPRHDFRRSWLLSEQQVRALDSIHRKYAEQASGTLSAMVRRKARVELAEIRQCTYFDFIRSLHNPTSLQLVYCTPGKQPFVAEMNPCILFPTLDYLLGAASEKSAFPVRPFTRLEAPLVRDVFRRLLGDLADTWSARGEGRQRFRFDLGEAEHNPLLMQVFGPSEPTVVCAFRLYLKSLSGALHVCFPTKPFEGTFGRLVRSAVPCSALSDEEEGRPILERLEHSGLRLTAELAAIPIALEDLLPLRAGDIIDTQLDPASEVSVCLDGKRVFRGQAVTHEGRRSIRITGLGREDMLTES